MTKTFHIGESCLHGTVKVTVDRNAKFTVNFYNYKTTDLQETAKFDFVDKAKLQWYLEDRMTPYYAGKIIDKFYTKSNQNAR